MARPRWIRWLYFGLALFACSLIISVDAATIEQYQDYSEGISTAQSPSQRGCSTGESSFIVSGRGGLPPRPMGVLDRDRILVDLGLETETSTSTTDVSIHETTNKPLEATEAIGQTFTNEPVSPTDPHRLVQQGRQFYRSGQWHNALAAWRQAEGAFESQGDALSQAMVLSNQALAYQQLDQLFAAEHAITASLTWIYSEDSISERTRTLAQVLNTQARLRLIQGQAQRALRSWEQATDLYRQLGEDTNVIQSLINQSQALRALGFHGRALEILERIDAQLASQPPSLIKAVALYNLGNIRRLVGDPAASQDALEKSLAIAETFESLPDINAALFSLGNTARIIGNYQESLRFYERAAGTATNITERFQAQVNQLAMSIELLEYRHPGYLLLQQIYVQINQLPRSRSSLYAQINFAQSLLKLRQRAKTSWGVADLTTIAQLLANTIQQSKDLGDLRAESYTLGYLGNLYEQTQQWSEANTLTVRALNLAQQLTNPEDVAYLWQWQLGRIFKAQGKNQDAIAAYRASINSLQAIRLDLLTIIDSNVQLSFRESIEPVYRELVPLLLESADTESSSNSWNKPDVLYEAINVIESIQLIESEDFLKQACLENISSFADKIDSKSAVIYSNLLEDQINIILRLPDQSLHHYTTILSENELETTLNSFRKILVEDSSQREKFDIEVFLSLAQKLYDWLLRGVEPYLGQGEIETITFIIDSSLYNFPIAALHDGQQFLIEKYSISLGLKSPNPKRLQRRELRVLAAGLSDSVSYGSPEQSKVFDELMAILSQVADTTVLLNRDFTSANIQSLLNRTYYPIIHLATYGQLSSKLENTFILTGDSRVPGRFLWYFLKSPNLTRQEPIELLVLSGLKLAEGDGTAALGLAGFALQTGAQNTIATFWQVSDEATLVFMEQFYKELNDITITIGEALRRAQNFLLQSEKFSNPFFWATYTLFASWS